MQISANYRKLVQMIASWKTGKGKTRFDRMYHNLFGLEIQWKHQNGHIYLQIGQNGRFSTFFDESQKSRRAKRARGPRENPFLEAAGDNFKANKSISI